jgi:hypothetical protein
MNSTLKVDWPTYLSIINYFGSISSLNEEPISLLLSKSLASYASKIPSVPELPRKSHLFFHRDHDSNEMLIEDPYYSYIQKRFGLETSEMGEALKALTISFMSLPINLKEGLLKDDKNGETSSQLRGGLAS